MRTVPASDHNLAPHKFPTFAELANLGHSELHALAYRIAQIHQSRIALLAPADLASYVTAEHQYGVHLRVNKKHNLNGISERLQDVVFWRKIVHKKADTSRERQEVLSGKVGHHGQKYCSDLTLRILEEREELTNRKLQQLSKTQHGANPMSLDEITEARNNKKYLLALALLEVAKFRGFKTFFLTITCPSIFHSPEAHSKVSSAEGIYEAAYRFLTEFWGSLSATLRSNFTPHVDYFGLRATEVHEDGCPHYHIVLLCSPTVEPLLRKKLSKLFNEDPLRPADHFEKYSHEILKEHDQENHNERKLLNYSLKLLFDDNQSSPEIQQERNEKRRRSNHAIKASRKRTVQFFGVEGLAQKIAAVKNAARDNTAPEEVREIGRKLNIDRKDPRHNEIRLAAMVNFILNDAPRLELRWANRKNKYGEIIKKVSGVRLYRASRIPKLPSIAQQFLNAAMYRADREFKSYLSTRKDFFTGVSKLTNLRVTHNTSRYRRKFISKVKLHYPSAFALIYFWFNSRSRDSPATHRPSRAPPALAKFGCCRQARSLATKPRETGLKTINHRAPFWRSWTIISVPIAEHADLFDREQPERFVATQWLRSAHTRRGYSDIWSGSYRSVAQLWR